MLIPKNWNMIKVKSISFSGNSRSHNQNKEKSFSCIASEGVAFSMTECAVKEEEQRAPVPVLLPPPHQHT